MIRIDSTVVEADIRNPTDLGLAGDAAWTLAAEAVKASEFANPDAQHVQDRSRAVAKRLRRLSRTLAARIRHGKEVALKVTVRPVSRRAGRCAKRANSSASCAARGRGAQTKLRGPSDRAARRPRREGLRADHQGAGGREDHGPP